MNHHKKSLFDQLQPLKRLGEGTYGTVTLYKLPDGSQVAVKSIKSSEDGIEYSAINEINALQSLKGCSNIVDLIEVEVKVRFDDTKTLIMLPYHINDLNKFISQTPVLERVKYFTIVFDQLIIALKHLHDRSILHLDIKPGNILVDYLYDEVSREIDLQPECYLADFGLAKQTICLVPDKDKDMQTDYNVVTAPYRAPEIALNQPYNYKADVWSMGLTLLEYLTGKTIINADSDYEIVNLIIKYAQNKNITRKSLLQDSSIHNQIDIDVILKKGLGPDALKMLDNIYDLRGSRAEKLGEMLELDQNNRIGVDELINFAILEDDDRLICFDKQAMPNRNHHIVSKKITYEMIYILIDWMIDVSKEFGFVTKVLIAAVDLVDRYVTNFEIIRDKLQLLGLVCILIASKSAGDIIVDINDYVHVSDNAYTPKEIREMEVDVFKKMNYLTISCDISPLLKVVRMRENKSKWTNLKKLYKKVRSMGKIPAFLSYNELAAMYTSLQSPIRSPIRSRQSSPIRSR